MGDLLFLIFWFFLNTKKLVLSRDLNLIFAWLRIIKKYITNDYFILQSRAGKAIVAWRLDWRWYGSRTRRHDRAHWQMVNFHFDFLHEKCLIYWFHQLPEVAAERQRQHRVRDQVEGRFGPQYSPLLPVQRGCSATFPNHQKLRLQCCPLLLWYNLYFYFYNFTNKLHEWICDNWFVCRFSWEVVERLRGAELGKGDEQTAFWGGMRHRRDVRASGRRGAVGVALHHHHLHMLHCPRRIIPTVRRIWFCAKLPWNAQEASSPDQGKHQNDCFSFNFVNWCHETNSKVSR